MSVGIYNVVTKLLIVVKYLTRFNYFAFACILVIVFIFCLKCKRKIAKEEIRKLCNGSASYIQW